MSDEHHRYNRLSEPDLPQEQPTPPTQNVVSQALVAASLAPESLTPQDQRTVSQAQTVIIQLQPRKSRKLPQFNHRLSKILAIAQLVAGGLAILINSLGIEFNERHGYRYYGETGEADYQSGVDVYFYHRTIGYDVAVGLWCPILFVSLSAAFGFASAYKKTRCLVITQMVLSIVASLFVFLMLAMAVFAMGNDIRRLKIGFAITERVYEPFPTSPTQSYGGTTSAGSSPWDDVPHDESFRTKSTYSEPARKLAQKILALSVFWVIVSLVEFVACVWSATMCCRAYCCVQTEQRPAHPADTVRYTAPPHMGLGSHLLVVDQQGRQIPGAQIVQVPGASTTQPGHQPTGDMHYPTKSGLDGVPQTQDVAGTLLPPPYKL